MKLKNFINLTYINIAKKFSSKNILFTLFLFLMPVFGILSTYFLYRYNFGLNAFYFVFPKLIIWIILTRNFFMAPSIILDAESFSHNVSLKILGFNKFDLILSQFVTINIYATIPTSIFWFVFLNLCLIFHTQY